MYHVTHSIVLFDGVCNLCNGFVRFVIRRDKRDVFRFGSLQSEHAQKLVSQFGAPGADLTTIVLLEGDAISTESEAVLKIVATLGGGWKLVSWFLMIPGFIRDGLYRCIARYRYALFGQRASCMIPTADVEDKFITHFPL